MSDLLDALIEQRRNQAMDYQEYLEQVKQLAKQIIQPAGEAQANYPNSLDTPAKRSLYDNLGQDEALALAVDKAVRSTKKEGWIGNTMKEREIKNAIRGVIRDPDINLGNILELIKHQNEYQ